MNFNKDQKIHGYKKIACDYELDDGQILKDMECLCEVEMQGRPLLILPHYYKEKKTKHVTDHSTYETIYRHNYIKYITDELKTKAIFPFSQVYHDDQQLNKLKKIINGRSIVIPETKYIPGEITKADKFDPDNHLNISGLHFYLQLFFFS